jgi:hypothetical protein
VLWSAEQILRAGTCGALLFWQRHIRSESLRRLLLAARAGETLFSCCARWIAREMPRQQRFGSRKGCGASTSSTTTIDRRVTGLSRSAADLLADLGVDGTRRCGAGG